MDGILPSPPFDLRYGPAPRPEIAFVGVVHFTRRRRAPHHRRRIVEHCPDVIEFELRLQLGRLSFHDRERDERAARRRTWSTAATAKPPIQTCLVSDSHTERARRPRTGGSTNKCERSEERGG